MKGAVLAVVCLLACWVVGAMGMYNDGCTPGAECVPKHICSGGSEYTCSIYISSDIEQNLFCSVKYLYDR